MQIKTTNELPPHTCLDIYHLKKKDNYWKGCGGKGSLGILLGMQIGYSHYENQYGDVSKN